MTNDCSAYVECTATEVGKAPRQVQKEHECQDNAVCDTTSAFPQCVCAEGYTPGDDGVTCAPGPYFRPFLFSTHYSSNFS